MRVRLLVVLLFFIAHPFLCVSQTNQVRSNSRSLKLEQCIDLALANNLDVRIQRLSTDATTFSLTSAYGAYDPTFSIFARRDYLEQPPDVDFKKATPDNPYNLQTDSAGGTLSGIAPIGLNYQIGGRVAEQDATTFFGSTNIFPSGIRDTNQFLADFGLTARQHLLRDAWIDQDRRLIQLRRKDVNISEQGMTFQIMQTMLAVELAYYDLIAARELVRVEEKALELKQQFVAETRRRVEVGDLPPLDSDQAETQLATTETALLGAREMLVDRQNALKVLLSDDFRSWVDVDLQPAEPLVATEQKLDRSESFKSALKNRPDLIQARLMIERNDVDVRFFRNQLFPTLDLLGHYGGLGIQTNGSSAVSDALHFRNHEYYYGVVLTVPLTRLRERSDYRASQARKEIAELQLQRAEQALFVEIADGVNRVQSRFSQVGSTRRARAYAEAALAAEQKKLANGLSTSFIVLQLQETLTAARTAEVQAIADYNKTLAQLAFAEGRTMERHRLELQWQ